MPAWHFFTLTTCLPTFVCPSIFSTSNFHPSFYPTFFSWFILFFIPFLYSSALFFLLCIVLLDVPQLCIVLPSLPFIPSSSTTNMSSILSIFIKIVFRNYLSNNFEPLERDRKGLILIIDKDNFEYSKLTPTNFQLQLSSI
jgi:hypothetical protein